MDDKKTDDLRKLAIFTSLSLEQLKEFIGICREKTCQDQDKIFSERELGNAMYIIRFGSVKIIRQNQDKQEEIVTFGPGDFFGEVGLFGDVLRTASAIAVKQTVLLEIPRIEFNNFILDKSLVGVKILYHMLAEMAKRLRLKNRQGDDWAF